MKSNGRALGVFILTLVAVPALLACIPSSVDPPPGAGTLRYRDEVFGSFTVTSDLQYGSAPDLSNNPVALTLDLYQPDGDAVAQRPAVIWAHGGGYFSGDKARGPAVAMGPLLAKRGYVFASINYRLLGPGKCDAAGGVSAGCYAAAVAAIHDAQAAVRWLRANAGAYGIDPNRIGIGGESAGAISATGVGVYSDQPGDSGNPGYSSNVQAWVSISGGLPNGILVDSRDAPGFLFSGTNDVTVPYHWSVETANAMSAAGVPVVFRTLEGAGHVPWVEYGDLFQTQSVNFFYRYLDLAHAQH